MTQLAEFHQDNEACLGSYCADHVLSHAGFQHVPWASFGKRCDESFGVRVFVSFYCMLARLGWISWNQPECSEIRFVCGTLVRMPMAVATFDSLHWRKMRCLAALSLGSEFIDLDMVEVSSSSNMKVDRHAKTSNLHNTIPIDIHTHYGLSKLTPYLSSLVESNFCCLRTSLGRLVPNMHVVVPLLVKPATNIHGGIYGLATLVNLESPKPVALACKKKKTTSANSMSHILIT